MMLGVHCSVSGGLFHAFDEATSLGIDTFQIFTRNQRQWDAKPVSPEEQEAFSSAWKKSGVKSIFSHASYLINLGSPNKELQQKSIVAITEEVKRCYKLGLSFTVLHPGSAVGSNEQETIPRIGEALREVIAATTNAQAGILLENTAGQGSAVGYRFEHLRAIMDIAGSERIGTCFDTCHAFAAGYDIRTKQGLESVIRKLDDTVGLKYLKALHLNDSKGALGSRIDRHEHIGRGNIGTDAFSWIMQQFTGIPKVIETDKDNDMDAINLTLLRKLAGAL